MIRYNLKPRGEFEYDKWALSILPLINEIKRLRYLYEKGEHHALIQSVHTLNDLSHEAMLESLLVKILTLRGNA